MDSKKTAAQETVELGQRVRALRMQRDWSQGRLARESGLSEAYISKLEMGGYRGTGIHLNTLQKLAQGLKVSLDELLGREASPPIADTTDEVVRGLSRLTGQDEDFVRGWLHDMLALKPPLDMAWVSYLRSLSRIGGSGEPSSPAQAVPRGGEPGAGEAGTDPDTPPWNDAGEAQRVRGRNHRTGFIGDSGNRDGSWGDPPLAYFTTGNPAHSSARIPAPGAYGGAERN